MTSAERMKALHDRIQELRGMLASGVGDEAATLAERDAIRLERDR